MSRNNKILIILSACALVIIFLILGFVYLFANKSGVPSSTGDISGTPFNPFGSTDNLSNPSATSSGVKLPERTPNTQPIPLLRRLSDTPVSSYVTLAYVQKADRTYVSFARFSQRQDGHIFEIPLAFIAPAAKLSNTTVPRLAESMWSSDGSHVVLRYLDLNNTTISTYLAKLTYTTPTPEMELLLTETSNATATLQGSFLEENIPAALFSPDGKKMLYLITNDNGTNVYIKDLVKESTKLVLTTPFRELTPTWDEQNAPLIYTKPSAVFAGLVLRLDLAKNSVDQILSDVVSVTARTSPDGKRLIYYSSRDGLTTLSQLNLATQAISRVPVVTMPEKCVWSQLESGVLYCGVPTTQPGKNTLEDWYRGKTHTSDQLWKINLETEETTLLVDPKDAVGETMDMTQLMLSPQEDFLLFVDKADGILWSAKIGEPVYKLPSDVHTQTATSSAP